jgi:oligopeptide/dipeptide ABC transporter ATP-binding protein
MEGSTDGLTWAHQYAAYVRAHNELGYGPWSDAWTFSVVEELSITPPTVAPTQAVGYPYARMLLSAVPNPDPDVPMSFSVEGEVADAGDLPPGCSFQPRCRECLERCKREGPQLTVLPEGRAAACHLVRNEK